jgi:hypothetical protein
LDRESSAAIGQRLHDAAAEAVRQVTALGSALLLMATAVLVAGAA